MSELIQSVKDGKIQETGNSESKTTKKVGGELGKDAFMKLLVTQMQYQDPLNPNSNTEYIAQLTTFSQLEQMQNVAKTTTNSQAFSLVGKTVTVKTDSTTKDTPRYVTGKVDFVYVSGSSTKLSIDGKLYSVEQLDTVMDDDYASANSSDSTNGASGSTAGGSTAGSTTDNSAGGTAAGGTTDNSAGNTAGGSN
ncbi:MAG TPA: hypothetical protein GXX75_07995 [Clostridiales bacterium]|nr:hypothetical protein [Clostridiales bacterium]